MDFSPASLAIIKIVVSFAVILTAMHFRTGLGPAILLGSLTAALLSDLSLPAWGKTLALVPTQESFLALVFMLYLLLLLSGVQAASGQSKRLVMELEKRIKWPKARLVVFPALVGLLPMPGGALFSCPMLDMAARSTPLSPERKALINYWFRHMWEVAWPLYPGYILTSSLLGLPLSTLCKYTVPMVAAFFLIGSYFFLRNIPTPVPEAPGDMDDRTSTRQTKGGGSSVFLEALPLIITIGGAGPFYLLLHYIFPALPSQYAFSCSLFCGVVTAFFQGRHGLDRQKLTKLFFDKGTAKMMFVIFAIYGFKDVIAASGMLASISALGTSGPALYSLFFILPFIGGTITGVMVGYVGATFPILISLLEQTGMQEHTLPLIVLALMAGNCGQMISPLHVCFAVTCDYYKIPLSGIWRKLVAPVVVVALVSLVWASLLDLSGAHF